MEGQLRRGYVEATSSFTGEYSTDWAAVMAASVLMSLPVLVIFLVFQRYFVRGLAEAAVKG
jgi:ABC-type glycerol-3-phosphate transport system permease component